MALFRLYQGDLQATRLRLSARRGMGGRKLSPLERGWSGSSPQGKIFGAPKSASPFCKFAALVIGVELKMKMIHIYYQKYMNDNPVDIHFQ